MRLGRRPFSDKNDLGGSVRRAPQVLVSTEGTYPFIVGGVSTWCDALVSGLTGVDWHVLAITAGGLRRESVFELPPNLVSLTKRELWSDSIAPGNALSKAIPRGAHHLVADLAHGIFDWDARPADLLAVLVRFREHPSLVASTFRSRRSWHQFVDIMRTFGSNDEIDFTLADAAEIYQTLYWVARSAAEPTRTGSHLAPVDLHLVTAAGWAGIGAVIDKSLHDCPLVLAEHGVYVREAYLQSARNVHSSQARRWSAARLARGLSKLTYAMADVVAPVTQANARWEKALGVEEHRIRPIYNGVLVPPTMRPFPKVQRVVSLGRVDPLKDIKTMLRCAAAVLEQRPDVEFVHYGPVPEGNEAYFAACLQLHYDLELGDRFKFAGNTDDAFAAWASSSVAVFSSISEGFPVAVLEAMAVGRPVVATAVGGVPEALAGCGLTVRPGDYEGLAAGILRIVNDPHLQVRLGERSYLKVRQEFGMDQCLSNYRDLIATLTGYDLPAPVAPVLPGLDDESELSPPAGDYGYSEEFVSPSEFRQRQ